MDIKDLVPSTRPDILYGQRVNKRLSSLLFSSISRNRSVGLRITHNRLCSADISATRRETTGRMLYCIGVDGERKRNGATGHTDPITFSADTMNRMRWLDTDLDTKTKGYPRVWLLLPFHESESGNTEH
jgi:hypothetical protein